MKAPVVLVAGIVVCALSGCASGTNGSPTPTATGPTSGTTSSPSSGSLTADDLVAAQWSGRATHPAAPSTVTVIRGPAHCDWGSSIWLHLSSSAGSDAGTDDDIRQYVRDPHDVLTDEVGKKTSLDLDANLPDAAEPTGYHVDSVELWLGEDAGDDAVFVVFDDHVERWPRTEQVIACG